MIQVHGLNIKNLIKSRSRVASNPMQGDKVNKIELDLNDLFLKCRMNSLIAGKTMKIIIRNSEYSMIDRFFLLVTCIRPQG